MTVSEYLDARQRRSDVQRMSTLAILILIGGVIPCSAPLVLIFGLLFVIPQRRTLPEMVPMYRLFLYLGFSLSAVWVLIIVGVLALTGGGVA